MTNGTGNTWPKIILSGSNWSVRIRHDVSRGAGDMGPLPMEGHNRGTDLNLRQRTRVII